MPLSFPIPPRFCLPLVLCLMAGCRKAEIASYIAPKEVESVPQKKSPLTYKAPAEWPEAPSDRMNTAQFTCKTASGVVNINITALESMVGKELLLVNMWRGVLAQTELPEAEAMKSLLPVSVGNESGTMFEVTGKRENEEVTIVTAFVHREEKSWFFKLQGPPAAVALQKATFVDFLKTVQLQTL